MPARSAELDHFRPKVREIGGVRANRATELDLRLFGGMTIKVAHRRTRTISTFLG